MDDRPTPERIEYLRRTSRMQIGSPESIARGLVQEQQELIAEIDALRSQVATLTVERDEAQDRLILSEARQLKANDERDAALADARELAAECRIHREPVTDTGHADRWRRLRIAITETDASGALSRHGGEK